MSGGPREAGAPGERGPRAEPRVGLFVIGAQKCGTTGLAAALAAHPRIDFCARKEPHFFSRAGPDWSDRLDTYHALFEPPTGRLRAEASTSYTFLPRHPGTAERVHAYNPEARMVYLMRDPVERIVSHYLHRWSRRRTRRPIGDEVLADPDYLDRSRYASQLEPWLRRFGPGRVRPLVFEEHVTDPVAGVAEVLAWVGLDPVVEAAPDRVVNPSEGRRYFRLRPLRGLARRPELRAAARRVPEPLRAGLRRLAQGRVTGRPRLPDGVAARLVEALEEEVRGVESILGRPVEAWGRWR